MFSVHRELLRLQGSQVTDSGQHTLLEAPTWAEVQRMRGPVGMGSMSAFMDSGAGLWFWVTVATCPLPVGASPTPRSLYSSTGMNAGDGENKEA